MAMARPTRMAVAAFCPHNVASRVLRSEVTVLMVCKACSAVLAVSRPRSATLTMVCLILVVDGWRASR